MNRLALVLLLMVIALVGVGFYRGWFTLTSQDAVQGENKVNVNLTVDKDKVQEDIATVEKKTQDLADSVTDGVKDASSPTTTPVEPATPK